MRTTKSNKAKLILNNGGDTTMIRIIRGVLPELLTANLNQATMSKGNQHVNFQTSHLDGRKNGDSYQNRETPIKPI